MKESESVKITHKEYLLVSKSKGMGIFTASPSHRELLRGERVPVLLSAVSLLPCVVTGA